MNSVNIIGRLTKDLDLRYTPNGKAVASGNLAVDSYSKGESKADFIPFVIWDKQAENLANFTKKGSRIGIKGSLKTRNYENSEGKKVFVIEVLVDGFNGFDLLDSKKDSGTSYSKTKPKNDTSMYNADPFDKSGTPIDISNSDLPF